MIGTSTTLRIPTLRSAIVNTQSRSQTLSFQAASSRLTVYNPRARLRSSTMATASATRQRLDNSAIFICDLQDKFRPAIHEFDKVILTTNKILRAAAALNIPTYFTTQNAARLGPIVPELQPHLSDPNCRVPNADKTLFSMWLPELVEALPTHPSSPSSSSSSPSSKAADIILLGIESHICITQTTLDALRAGHKVYLLADGISSCNREEVPLALNRLRAEGAVVTTSESWLYEAVGDASAPEFKRLIGVVKESVQDTKRALQALAPVAGGDGGAAPKI